MQHPIDGGFVQIQFRTQIHRPQRLIVGYKFQQDAQGFFDRLMCFNDCAHERILLHIIQLNIKNILLYATIIYLDDIGLLVNTYFS